MTYAFAQWWVRCWCLVGGFGVGLSFLLWPLQNVALLWVAMFLSAIPLLALSFRSSGEGTDWLRHTRLAGLLASGSLAVIAVADVDGGLVVVLTLVAGLSSPWTVRRVGAWAHQAFDAGKPARLEPTEEAPPPKLTAAHTADVLRAMSNPELCLEWRRTFMRLQHAASPQDFIDVVTLRQSLLDEMDRRSPSALRAWIASGARAAGGPDRFLKEGHGSTGSEAA